MNTGIELIMVQTILDGPRLNPRHGGPAKQLIVLLHGYGADGNDLIGLAPHWQGLLPDAAFVAPHAPDSIPGLPMGRQWFALNQYDPNMMRREPAHSAKIFEAMERGAEGVADKLHGFLDAELARYTLPERKLALVGFSQGTMMALHVGLRRADQPAGILGYSGALIGGNRLKAEITARPPVRLIHGDADDIVPIEAMHSAVSTLGEMAVMIDWHVCHGLGHGIDPEGLELGGQALKLWLETN